jgi:RND family efflux transporter MFP subunit
MNLRLFKLINLFFIILFFSACAKKAAIPPKAPPPVVKTIQVKKSQFYDSEKYLATLKSRQSVNLNPEIISKVENIYVKSGDRVSKGQLLISLRADEEISSLNSQIALSSSKNEVISSKGAEVQEAKANLDFAKGRQERYKQLQQKDLISKNQLEEYENQLAKAQNTYNSLKFNLAGANDELKQAKSTINEKRARVNKLRIVAPFSGIVQDIPAKVGDSVSNSTTLISIANADSLEVYLNIPVDKAIGVKSGSLIELLSPEDEILATSQVSFTSSTVDPQTQTVLVKANLNNNEGLFRDNQQIKCRVKYQQKTGILIPASVISRFGDTTFIFLLAKDDKGQTIAKQRPVQLKKLVDNKSYEVAEGLADGEIIISTGIQKLADNSPVKLAEEEVEK